MPAVAKAMATDLSALEPAHASYFQANEPSFDASLQPWMDAIAAFKAKYAGTPVATTEPVADYLLQAMGDDNLTPFSFQADIMNGTDPTPQDVSLENGFFTKHQVKVFCYNQQVTDSLDRRRSARPHKQPGAGGRRLRDDADARLRLPVVDDGRDSTPSRRPSPPVRLDPAPVIDLPGRAGVGTAGAATVLRSRT